MSVIDYSWWRPTTDQLKAAGVNVVCRYVAPGQLGSGKIISLAEYQALNAAGVHVILNFESTGTSWRGGYAAGVTEGTVARAQARAVGYPDVWPVIQSMDEGMPAALVQTAIDYQRGFNDGGKCGPQGAYGTTLVLDALFNAGLIKVGWQTNARGWEGNAADCTRALMFQRTSHPLGSLPANQYDYNDVNPAGLTPYPFIGTQPAPQVVAQPAPVIKHTVEADMANARAGIVTLKHYGFGLHAGVFDAGATVHECQATVHGPAPKAAVPGSADDWWGPTIDVKVRAQVRGNHVVVTAFSGPEWKPGNPAVQVHVLALV